MIAVIDYGRGNLGSVEKAFRRVGCPAVVTQDPRAVDDAQAVVLPGDGAFHDAMRNLDALGLLPALRRALDGTRPFLGICLGYQLLFSTSEEFGEGRGLDVVPGAVRRLPPGPKIPHMGWNRVEHAGDLKLFDGIPPAARFYFVHSFYPVVAGSVSTDRTEGGLTQMRVAPEARPLRIAWCQYGIRFAAAIEVGRIYATQFHPEKSQRWGLRMLENFAAIVKDGA
ncbi:MAG: imidazole glycerol phosphate synthase subunit HisH [Candidatus Rokuibacteriota bacterium]|nr:MAG: imidazole glycerol phosphate synthase subunit HisH [Candidatus Rokubacteria bacterium]